MAIDEPVRPPRASRRERRKQVTRAELIRAGRKLFSERGLAEVRIEDLAEQADVAKGTVYLYFDGKPELIRAVVAEGFAALEERVSAAAAGASSTAAYLERVIDAHLEFFAEHPDLMRIFHQARGMLAFRRAEWRPLREPLERHVAYLSAGLARRRGPGARPGARDRDLAIAIFGCVSGVASMHAALGLPEGPRLELREALATLAATRPGRRTRRRP